MDHATAGGQFLYDRIVQHDQDTERLVGELLAACVIYHHGPGLPDVIQPDGTATLFERRTINITETHLDEAMANLDESIKEKIEGILEDENFLTETVNILTGLIKTAKNKTNRYFDLGLTARFLSSCLIDADRRSSAYYDQGISLTLENAKVKADWKQLLGRLEAHLSGLSTDGKINEIRTGISERCADFAKRESGIYTLTAATGAGKTLASLRYALSHAAEYGKDRTYIIAPHTSILDQNADVIRGILDPDGKNGEVLLEHHSNLDRGEKSEYYTDSSQTWNVPIVITTMVQFLEAFFGSGTRKIRRMHQLANSVIIFDEVQTLPISCTYLFTWALQYLCKNCKVSALLCTATQPGLDKLHPDFALPIPSENEIIPDVSIHFSELKRVELVDGLKQ
jgi:CRISPR-associated endonuclease/helicase Cas3